MPRARVPQTKYISGRGNFSFFKPRSKELVFFLFCSARFQSKNVLIKIVLTMYVKRYSIKLKFARL